MRGQTFEVAVFLAGMAGVFSVCCGPRQVEDAATKAEHVVVVGSYERALDRCRDEAKAAQSMAVYDACEREATARLCASRPELQGKPFCAEVSDAGR